MSVACWNMQKDFCQIHVFKFQAIASKLQQLGNSTALAKLLVYHIMLYSVDCEPKFQPPYVMLVKPS